MLRIQGIFEISGTSYRIESGEPVLENVKETLSYLKGQGHIIALVTAGKRIDARKFMEEADILKYFNEDLILYGEDSIGKHSLFGQMSKLLGREYGIGPERTLIVEDSLSGIADANSHGFPSMLVFTGNTTKQRIFGVGGKILLELEKRPTIIADSMAALRG